MLLSPLKRADGRSTSLLEVPKAWFASSVPQSPRARGYSGVPPPTVTPRRSAPVQVKVLSEELETPTNVHRWRQLEGSDPKEFELPASPAAAVSRPWGFLPWLCPAIRKGKNIQKMYPGPQQTNF